MRLRRRLALAITFASLASLPPASAGAQGTRDSLTAGKRAYARADYAAAVRALPIGLAAAPRDTAWASGVHILLDALLVTDTANVEIWARWAVRAWPALRADSIAFPPAVARRIVTALVAFAARSAEDTLALTVWEPAADWAAGRGVLRLARGPVDVIAIIEGVGTILPGESRTLPSAVYTLSITADGYQPLRVSREVVPGLATVITARLRRGQAGPVADAPTIAPPDAGVTRGAPLAAGGAVTCQVLPDQQVACWGNNRFGQFGNGAADTTQAMGVVASDSAFTAVSVGERHACALSRSGKVLCWGQGGAGQLGHGQTATSTVPAAVAGPQPFATVAAGGLHTCALTAVGAAWCWGANANGQLGNRSGSASAVPVPVAMPAGVTFTQIAAGSSHTCALTAAGAVWCWGNNATGQLGNGSTVAANIPTAVPNAPAFRAITAGHSHTCAVAVTGAAGCWGANTDGQLGTGNTGTLLTRPALVAGDFTSFRNIAAGDNHTCALTADSAAYCWGAGRAGQLGNNQQSDSPRPVLAIGGHDFRALTLGSSHSCAVTADGYAWCWGDNSGAQVGALAGRAVPAATPVLVRPAAPAPRSEAAAPANALREGFDDGDWTRAPAWQADSAAGATIVVREGSLQIARAFPRGRVAAAGLTLPVRVPVTRATALTLDVLVEDGRAPGGCGVNCAAWPATVRLRVRNHDLTESELWIVFGESSWRPPRALGPVSFVVREAPRARWIRGERFVLREYLPRADSVIAISLGGIGLAYTARYDNVVLASPQPASLAVHPDTARLTEAGATRRLTAQVRDAQGGTMPWIGVTWTSSDTTVARVDGTGLVTAVGNGIARIRATASPLADSARVTVRIPSPRRPTRRP